MREWCERSLPLLKTQGREFRPFIAKSDRRGCLGGHSDAIEQKLVLSRLAFPFTRVLYDHTERINDLGSR